MKFDEEMFHSDTPDLFDKTGRGRRGSKQRSVLLNKRN